jgi:hypothetical protein
MHGREKSSRAVPLIRGQVVSTRQIDCKSATRAITLCHRGKPGDCDRQYRRRLPSLHGVIEGPWVRLTSRHADSKSPDFGAQTSR